MPGDDTVTQADKWHGGRLRTFVPHGVHRIELKVSRDYVPFIRGWVVRAEQPYHFVHPEHPDLELLLDARDGRIRCVGVVSREGGPEITGQLLRDVSIERGVRQSFEMSGFVARLVEHEGELVAELPYRRHLARERASKFKTSRGRRMGDDDRILELEAEAKTFRQPVESYLAHALPEEFGGIPYDTIRQRVARARKRQRERHLGSR
jgi:hypothetical protein